MEHRRNQRCRPAARRRGYSLLELTAAVMVLGVALSGLFPLTVMLSRDLQPIPTNSNPRYDCRTPARDGNTTGTAPGGESRAYGRHVWYLTPFHNATTPATDAWVRKLGCSAQIKANVADACPATLSVSPPPTGVDLTSLATPVAIQPSSTYLDDYDGTPSSNDGSGTFALASGWTPVSAAGYQGDYHWYYIPAAQCSGAVDNLATWQVTVPASGSYSIQATWPTGTPYDQNLGPVTYTVIIPGQNNQVFTLNQANPGSLVDGDGSTRWSSLLPPTPLTGGSVVTVILGYPGQQTTHDVYILADAVRLALNNDVKINSLERSLGGTNGNSNSADVTASVSVTVNLPQ